MAKIGTDTSEATFEFISVRRNDSESIPWVRCASGNVHFVPWYSLSRNDGKISRLTHFCHEIKFELLQTPFLEDINISFGNMPGFKRKNPKCQAYKSCTCLNWASLTWPTAQLRNALLETSIQAGITDYTKHDRVKKQRRLSPSSVRHQEAEKL